MTVLLFFVLMQLAWTYGASSGGGAYSYSDSTGNKVSGTYDLNNGRIIHTSGDPLPAHFSDTELPGYGYGFGYENQGYHDNQGDDFYPEFFSNFENLLQDSVSRQASRKRVFRSNVENQRLAYNAARKAFDLSTNQAGYFPNFASRFPHPPFPGFGGHKGFNRFPSFPNFAMPYFPNSAFAGAALGPGFRRQIAAINPANPNSPNVNINRISHYSDSPRSGYQAVSSRSYASSSNINGQEVSRRGAETIVDDNGRVTKYKVEN